MHSKRKDGRRKWERGIGEDRKTKRWREKIKDTRGVRLKDIDSGKKAKVRKRGRKRKGGDLFRERQRVVIIRGRTGK